MARRRYNIGILIGCLLLSAVLWGYVTLTRTTEDDVEIPLVVEAPANQALLSTVPRTITVRVRGSGLQILNMKYLNKTSDCRIDLGRVRPTSGSLYEIERDDLVRSTTVPGALSIVSVTPTALILTTGDLFRQEVPVELVSHITCRDGFEIVGQPILDPAIVEIRGTRSIVESISAWRTQKVSLDDVHEPVELNVPMSDSLMTVLNVVPSLITVRMDVQQTAEMVVHDVDVRLGQETADLRIEPARISVTVQGGAAVLAGLTPSQLHAMIATTTPGPTKPAILTPDGVRVISTEPSFVRVVRRTP